MFFGNRIVGHVTRAAKCCQNPRPRSQRQSARIVDTLAPKPRKASSPRMVSMQRSANPARKPWYSVPETRRFRASRLLCR
jgi:hypothetical protein